MDLHLQEFILSTHLGGVPFFIMSKMSSFLSYFSKDITSKITKARISSWISMCYGAPFTPENRARYRGWPWLYICFGLPIILLLEMFDVLPGDHGWTWFIINILILSAVFALTELMLNKLALFVKKNQDNPQ